MVVNCGIQIDPGVCVTNIAGEEKGIQKVSFSNVSLHSCIMRAGIEHWSSFRYFTAFQNFFFCVCVFGFLDSLCFLSLHKFDTSLLHASLYFASLLSLCVADSSLSLHKSDS